jgi:hypothetical protein
MPGISRAQDTLICDNGGFEDGFSNWNGYHTRYFSGGNLCIPSKNDTPSTWIFDSLPEFRRFEIVSSGIDPLVGIQKTKFGNKSLKINNQYGHLADCQGSGDANKITKTFIVDSLNLYFSVWYAAILEKPLGHEDNQPFISIKCDLATKGGLCLNATDLECNSMYYDSICPSRAEMLVLDWNCLKFEIPESEIGNQATLEIIVADCAQGAHFGYAYIDGLCESCINSDLLSVQIDDVSNYGCKEDTIQVCGSYDLSNICGTDWTLTNIQIPGLNPSGFSVDENAQTFCVDIPISEFWDTTCQKYYAILQFNAPDFTLPLIYSNEFQICPNSYKNYIINEEIGICQDNGTALLISDDYYYVNVQLINFEADSWTMEKQLNDSYPNESGKYIIKSGSGNGIISLGPILIQEGDWTLTIKVKNCTFTYQIVAPEFCSGCDKFYGVKIGNVLCDNNGTTTTSDDEWSFDINVPGSGSYTLTGYGTYNYDSTHKINVVGNIGLNCINFSLSDGPSCNAHFNICPPKTCSEIPNECRLEVYVKDIYCNQNGTQYYFNLITQGTNSTLCYQSKSINDPNNTNNPNNQQGSIPSGALGPFSEDIELTVYLCNSTQCYKLLIIPKPDCNNLDFRENVGEIKKESVSELVVVPNPINSNVISLKSYLRATEFEFCNFSGVILYHGNFVGTEYSLHMNIPSGIYFLKFKKSDGGIEFLKVIKL